jgi:low affinity Fe/Cu permease
VVRNQSSSRTNPSLDRTLLVPHCPRTKPSPRRHLRDVTSTRSGFRQGTGGYTSRVDEDQQLQMGGPQALSPSEIDGQRGRFDQVAAVAVHTVSRGPFFVVCIAGVLVWLGLGLLTGFSDTWLAAGSAVMSVVIVVLVAVLENAQRRSDQAIQRKLNAIAEALADFMCETNVDQQQVDELRAAVGIEHRESAGAVSKKA